MTTSPNVCFRCEEPVVWLPRGWVHSEGGASGMRYPQCGWRGAPYPSPVRCPRYGSRDVRDDHAALRRRR